MDRIARDLVVSLERRDDASALRAFLAGVVLAITTVIGLFISANAHDAGFTFFGVSCCSLFGVLMLFRLIALATASPETHP